VGRVSRFVDEDAHFDAVPGCPLRGARAGRATAQSDERACATCRYNVCFPSQPTVGCTWRTPAPVVSAARARLPAALAPDLDALLALRRPIDPRELGPWSALAEAWLAQVSADDEAGREVASTIARFARAGLGLALAVEVLA
jgi:hypothetical protein